MDAKRDDLPGWRRGLGWAGVWVFGGAIDDDPGEFGNWIESVGYTALWIGGGNPDPAALARLEAILSATSRLVVATGITNIWAWEPEELARRTNRLHEAFPDRVVLGLGVSHGPLVEAMGQRYEHPYAAMVSFLDQLDAARDATFAGQGAGAGPAPRVLAALGDRMLRLAGERSAGAHPYLTTPEHTERARSVLGAGPLLAPEQALVVEEDPELARLRARGYLERYLRLPNYAANLRRLGWSDTDLEGEGSDALVDALVPHGTADEVVGALRAHVHAGADHVCIQPLADGRGIDRYALELLVPALRAYGAMDRAFQKIDFPSD